MTLAPLPGFAQGNLLPEALGGLPASAPKQRETPLPTPNVYEVRPTRPVKPLTADEQKKLEAELSSLRDLQKNRANPPPPSPKKAAAPAPGPLNLAKPDPGAKPAAKAKPSPAAKPAPVAKKTPPPKAAPVKREAAKPEIVPDAKQPAGPMRLIN